VENLKLMSMAGNEPKEIVIIGIEPKEIKFGTELSPELQQKVPELVKVVLKEMGLPAAPR